MSGKTAKARKTGSALQERSPLYKGDPQTLLIRHRKCFVRFAAPLQEEMNCLFDEVSADTETSGVSGDVSFPVIQFSEFSKEYNVEIQVPGMKPENLDISTTYNFLTIAEDSKGSKIPAFHRTLSLPENAAASKAKASFRSDVLTVSIPKKRLQTAQPDQKRVTL